MLTGFLSLAGVLLSILFWGMKRHAATVDDPRAQNLKRYAQIDRDLVARNSLAASLHASSDLDELDRLQNRGAGNSE